MPHPVLPLFSVRRADIETLARELEARGRARATVTRRLCTIAGFYRYALESGQMTRGSRLRACISVGGAAVYPDGYTQWAGAAGTPAGCRVTVELFDKSSLPRRPQDPAILRRRRYA